MGQWRARGGGGTGDDSGRGRGGPMIVRREMSGRGGTRGQGGVCLGWGPGGEGARVEEGGMLVHVREGQGFLPRFPQMRSPLLCPRELHPPLSPLAFSFL